MRKLFGDRGQTDSVLIAGVIYTGSGVIGEQDTAKDVAQSMPDWEI